MEVQTREKILFLHLIHSFESACLVGLGKLPGPDGHCIVELEAAAFAIDMLDMLKSRTKGNLAEEEDRHLEAVVANLKLNYLAEKERRGKEAEETPADAKAEKPDAPQ
ncbi:MAG: DUF1844 domain-containing protein [bacterium]